MRCLIDKTHDIGYFANNYQAIRDFGAFYEIGHLDMERQEVQVFINGSKNNITWLSCSEIARLCKNNTGVTHKFVIEDISIYYVVFDAEHDQHKFYSKDLAEEFADRLMIRYSKYFGVDTVEEVGRYRE